jgi:ParB family chromosome partitioning protein
MVSLRNTLANVEANLLESLGSRSSARDVALAPMPEAKDIGRRPVQGFGSVDIEQVVPDPHQPRTEFSPESLQRMAGSIRDRGQLAPIRVRWSEELSKWVIIAGERRWRAANLAGLSTIECYFHTGELSPSELLEQQLIENLLREDLKPLEEARAFYALMHLNGWNGKELAERLRIPASQVSRALAVLRLPEDIGKRVDAGEISARAAYELSKLDDPRQQRQLAEQAAAGKLTHEQAARLVRQRRGKRRNASRHTTLSFATELGWKVVVTSQRKGTYQEVEEALEDALAEVRHRIQNNVQIF